MKALGGWLIILIAIFFVWGWIENIVKLTELDFENPYKAEFIRIVGIPFFPVGGIVGHMEIEDK